MPGQAADFRAGFLVVDPIKATRMGTCVATPNTPNRGTVAIGRRQPCLKVLPVPLQKPALTLVRLPGRVCGSNPLRQDLAPAGGVVVPGARFNSVPVSSGLAHRLNGPFNFPNFGCSPAGIPYCHRSREVERQPGQGPLDDRTGPWPHSLKELWMQAGWKWLQLLHDVVSYECDDGPLLSEGADRLIEQHPVAGRILILCGGALITLHLSNLVPPPFDPLSLQYWRGVRGACQKYGKRFPAMGVFIRRLAWDESAACLD